MTITENLNAFLDDFGVSVVSGAISGTGLLDMPEQVVGDFAISSGLGVVVKTSLFGGLNYGDAITVDGTAYTVRELFKLDDGVFTRITLNQ